MHVVYYFEPWIELGRPDLRYHNVRFQMGPQARALLRHGVSVTFLMGDATHAACQREGYDFEGAPCRVITQAELRQIYPDYLSASLSLFRYDDASRSEQMGTLVREKLSGLPDPDVLVSFLSPAPFVSAEFPNCLLLYTEFGIFSRVPYPRSFYFDPFGMFGQSHLPTNAAAILEGGIAAVDHDQVRRFRGTTLYGEIGSYNPFSDIRWPERFKRTVLLPLQFSQYFGFDACCGYASQFEYLVDVLDQLDDDVGVVVTEHSGWEPVITPHNRAFLEQTYRNLIIADNVREHSYGSQYVIPAVDAVVSVSSSVGLQAMLWGKPLISPWRSHLAPLSATKSLGEASAFIKEQSGDYEDNDVYLNHLLSSYYFTEKYAYKGQFMKEWLEGRTRTFRERGLEASFYAPHRPSAPIGLASEMRHSEARDLIQRDLKQAPAVEARNDAFAELTAPMRKAAVVSFDVFDTLLERPLSAPHELFLLIQEDVRTVLGEPSFEFHKMRRLAEHRCRTESKQEEVTLSEIYDVIDTLTSGRFSRDVWLKVRDLEVATELRLCRPRTVGRRLFQQAKRLGKRVILVSDIYLPREVMERLVDRNGYGDHNGLFISSEIRRTKKRGSIYRHVMAELELTPGAFVHYGDNDESDIANAEKHGWAARMVPRAVAMMQASEVFSAIWKDEWSRVVYPTVRTQVSHGIYFGLCANRRFGEASDESGIFAGSPRVLGYTALGVLMLAFAKHVIKTAQRDGVQTLYFLSRDGWFIKQCYDAVAQHHEGAPESRYLHISRKALVTAQLTTLESWVTSLDTPFAPVSIRNLLRRRYGIEDASFVRTEHLERAGLVSLDQRVHPVHQLAHLKELFRGIYPDVADRFRDNARGFDLYLRESGLFDERRVAVVDIGYAGSHQAALIDAGVAGLAGYYLMTHLGARGLVERHGVTVDGFVYQFVDHQATDNPFCRYVSLLETLFSHAEASLERYDVDVHGELALVFGRQPGSSRRSVLVEEAQFGALEFIQEALEAVAYDLGRLDYSVDFAGRTLVHSFAQPHPDDARLFSGVEFEDAFSGRDQTYVLAPVPGGTTPHAPPMSEEVAARFVAMSRWQEGALALVNQSTAAASSKFMAALRAALSSLNAPQDANSDATRREALQRKIRKLRRNPYLFFRDSQVPLLKSARHLFKE